MSPLKELLNSLSKRPTTSGTVGGFLSSTQVVVATATGSLTCRLGIDIKLQTGDRVAIAGDVIVGKLTPDSDIPQYVV